MTTYDNGKLVWARITFGKTVVEGECTYWEMGANGAYIKVIINGKEYLTATQNVLLGEERP